MMTDITRRNFIKGVLAIPIVAAVPALASIPMVAPIATTATVINPGRDYTFSYFYKHPYMDHWSIAIRGVDSPEEAIRHIKELPFDADGIKIWGAQVVDNTYEPSTYIQTSRTNYLTRSCDVIDSNKAGWFDDKK